MGAGRFNAQEIIDLVNVVADQAEELVEYLESQCVRGPRSICLIVKDYAIALQAALRGLLQVDGSALGWVAVRKEVRKVADVAQKADQVIIFLEHHHGEHNEDGEQTPIALPASLRLKKAVKKGSGAQRQRSRIDDYYWEAIPEVQREPMLQKKYLSSLSKKEREQAVLKNMTTYKQLASDTGVIRMAKRDTNPADTTVYHQTAARKRGGITPQRDVCDVFVGFVELNFVCARAYVGVSCNVRQCL